MEQQQDLGADTQFLQGTKQAGVEMGVPWDRETFAQPKQPNETRAPKPSTGREETHPLQWRVWLNDADVKKDNKGGRCS